MPCPPPTSSARSHPRRKDVWRFPYRASSAPVTINRLFSVARKARQLRTLDGNYDTMRSSMKQFAAGGARASRPAAPASLLHTTPTL